MIPGSLSRVMTEDRPGDRIVAVRNGVPIPFGQFREDVAAMVSHVGDCRRAAVICNDRYAFAVSMFGLLHAGAEVVVPANGRQGTLHQLSGQFDRLFGDELPGPPSGPRRELRALDADQARIDFFTSGSTGAPKPISKTLVALEREVAALDAVWGAELNGATVQAAVSQQHFYGFVFGLLWPLAAGRPFAAETHEVWESLLAAIEPGSVIVASPAHLGRIGGIAPLPAARRPSLIFSAGAPLPLAAALESEAILGTLPSEIFGSTETGAVATRRRDEPWRMLPGNEMRADAEGRLSVRSPYAGGEDWYETADLVEALAGGFRFIGRNDGIVKIEGKRVSLTEIEETLAQLPWVETAVAVILPGEPPKLAAAIVPTAEGWRQLKDIGSFRFGRLLRRGLADTQEPAGMPRRWRFVEKMPMRQLGKMNRADIVALFGNIHESA